MTRILSRADGDAFRTDRRTLAASHAGDLEDWVDLTFPPPARAGEKALVLTARSSLLNTLLFYDVMLVSRNRNTLD